ncbi:MAG: hypothetical protein LBQ59_04335 [Candidatus Peribacteria bacterium]|jgi:hypothetical protein|nr:hypothetical protein [Candidatus Peribacteria bacterium]
MSSKMINKKILIINDDIMTLDKNKIIKKYIEEKIDISNIEGNNININFERIKVILNKY